MVFVDLEAVPGTGAYRGMRGSRGRAHRRELSLQHAPSLGVRRSEREREKKEEAGAARRKKARGSRKEGRACSPLPPTYSPRGYEAKGAGVGIYCTHNPTPRTIPAKLLRTVTPQES